MMKAHWNAAVRVGASVALWPLFSVAAMGCTDDVIPTVTEVGPIVRPFEETTCKHTLSEGSTTRCGYVQVPEDHDDPTSPLIRIYATVFPATDATTATTPLIYLTGGPGTSTASAIALFEITDPTSDYAIYRQTFGDNRDLIVLDQRGTNYSEPSLYCGEELGPVATQAYTMTLTEATALRITKMEECYTRLTSSGINLSAFDTYQNAADVRSLALSLGHEKVNVYGASYGTRLTMTVMKYFPEVVENAVVDSVLPPELNPFEAQSEGLAYALSALWETAKVDFPDLESQFYGTIAKLEATPVKVDVTYPTGGTTKYSVTITGVEYSSYVSSELRNTPIDAALPYNISQMYTTEDYSLVAAAYLANIDFLFPSGGPGSEATALGMFESMNAADNGYYASLDVAESNILHYLETESLREYARQSFIYQNVNVLGKWPVDPLPREILYPLTTDIPTLLMVGSLDSATPLPFSQPSARYLSNHYYFDILAGHAVCYLSCACQLTDDFLKDPSVEPQNSCSTDPGWQTTAQ
jgi:pimeloyl-ACP methyl ester carboxylesterase